MTMPSIAELQKLDPAAVVLWVFFPDGPPADVYEPAQDGEAKIAARMTIMRQLGASTALHTHPHLFPEQRRLAPS